MLILSLDTTTRAGSAAVLDDDRVLAVAAGDPARTHGERLPHELDDVLGRAGVTLAAIDLLAVACGPGAFTGLRIGLATMQGLAMVLRRPVVGVSALDALATAGFADLGSSRARIGAWMDAARGEVFAALYDAAGEPGGVPTLTPLAGPEVDAPGALWQRWPAPAVVIGDGAVRYAALLAGTPAVAAPPLAPFLARLARRRVHDSPHHPHDLQPLYVRRPDAERARA